MPRKAMAPRRAAHSGKGRKAWTAGLAKRKYKKAACAGGRPKTKKTMARKAKRPRRAPSVRSLSSDVTEYSEMEDSVESVSTTPSPMDSGEPSDATEMTSCGGSTARQSESHSSDVMDSEAESDEINRDDTLPVHVGSTFKQGRYKAHRKLGYGAFSTVWLAWDQAENKFVALKIQNCSKDCMKAAREEITIHKEVAAGDAVGDKTVVKLLDHFEHKGVKNGKHVCMVFEYLGDNLLTLIKANKYKGLPLDVVKGLARQILTGLNYLHNDLKIIHTDLKPENVLLMSPLDPSKDPRLLASGGTTNIVRGDEINIPHRHRAPTPAPAKMHDPSKSLDGGEGRDRNNHQLEGKASGSRAASPAGGRSPKPAENATGSLPQDDAVGASDGKKQVEQAELTSEPSLDRLAIDSDPDIARDSDMYNKNQKPARAGSGGQQVKFNIPKGGQRGGKDSVASIDIRCKIVDLGTACWTNKHFTDDIQTRPYRCPEVLLGAKYSTSADMWSFACLVFELATGNILFNPRTGGSEFNRDEDHLAQITHILGPIPKRLAARGTHSRDYLTKNGELRRLKTRGHCPLHKLLVNDYKFNEKDAKELAAFLTPLLDLTPEKRPTADQCLQNPWLNSDLPAAQ